MGILGCLIKLTWRVVRVKDYTEHLVNHFWDESLGKSVGSTDVRVAVNLDQPNSEVLVYHEVVAKQFEVVLAVVGVELRLHSAVRIDDNVLHPGHKVMLDIDAEFALDVWTAVFKLLGVEVCLPLAKRESVTLFMNAVNLLVLNLETLVGEVDKVVAAVKRVL